MKNLIVITAAILLMFMSLNGFAEAESPTEPEATPASHEETQKKSVGIPDYLSVGVLFLSNKEPYAGIERENRVFPAIGLQSKRFTFFGPFAAYRLIGDADGINFSVTSRFQLFDGYEGSDSTVLSGMDERKGTVYLGAKLSTKLSYFRLSYALNQDILGEHGGTTMKLAIGSSFPLSIALQKLFGDVSLPFMLISSSIGVKYYSTAYVNYYYGVKDFETTAARPAYSANDGFSFVPEIGLWVKISEQVSWSSRYELEILPSDIKNSPIVDQKTKSMFFTSLSYLFYL